MSAGDELTEAKTGKGGRENGESEACAESIDRNAPAGSKNSLGAMSDCNGRPSTDDSVVEAMDEEGPLKQSPDSGQGR